MIHEYVAKRNTNVRFTNNVDIMKIKRKSLVILPIFLTLSACTVKSEKQAEPDTAAEAPSIVEQVEIAEEVTSDEQVTIEDISTPTDTVKTEVSEDEVVMLNQLGHRPKDQKLVVVRTNVETEFSVINAATGSSIYDGQLMDLAAGSFFAGEYKVGTFTNITDEGNYYISCGIGDSGTFRISEDVYGKLYQDLLNYVKQQEIVKPESDIEAEKLIISESKALLDLLVIYESDKDEEYRSEILRRLDKLMEYAEDEVTYGEGDISKRALFSYAAALIRGAEDLKDEESVSVDAYRERAIKVWDSITVLESLGYISDNEDYRDAAYCAAVEFYKIGEIGGGELADMDVNRLSGGLSENDLSGYGMFSLIDFEEGTAVSESAKTRLDVIVKDRIEMAEWDYFSTSYYGGPELPKPEKVSEQGMFFFLAEKVSDDKRIPVLAKRQLDYLLGENDEAVCYIKKYGYNTVSEETEGTRNTSLLYMLNQLDLENDAVENEETESEEE